MESDPNNFIGVWRDYLRIRVRINIEQPPKRRMKIGKSTTSWFRTNFKYEKLPTFCFICGIMGHSEKFCPKLFEISEQLIEKPYGLWMRAMPKKNLGRIGEKWLRSRVTESRTSVTVEVGVKIQVNRRIGVNLKLLQIRR